MPDDDRLHFERRACPVCLDGTLPPVTIFKRARAVLPNRLDRTIELPLTLGHCATCGHLYLNECVLSEELFPPTYTYKAGTAGMQRGIFGDLVDAVERRLPLDNAVVIDIGANDGSLLRLFSRKTDQLIAVDPATPPLPERRSRSGKLPAITVVNEYWDMEVAGELDDMLDEDRTRVLLLTNTLAQLPHLHDAVGGFAKLLRGNDLLVIQAPWAMPMLEQGLWDTIYHEHHHYFTLTAMRRLLQQHWLDVHDVEYLPHVHGGTLRYFIGRALRPGFSPTLALIEAHEARLHAAAHVFEDVVDTHEQALIKKLTGYDDFWAYGASAKGIMLLNALSDYGLRPTVVFDDTSEKIHHCVPGLGLPIAAGLTVPSHYPQAEAILLTAWNYAPKLVPDLRTVGYQHDILLPFPTPYAT